jgi:carbonic anhydrase/acetyltransferase-like protein (isoleucine patch superfamily)
VVRTGALVGAGAVVPGDTEVPSRAMALGVPATIKPDAVKEGAHEVAAAMYVHNGERYREQLRRIG